MNNHLFHLVVFTHICIISCTYADEGPSFDCSKVKSQVNKMICDSPTLSNLDRKLSDDYQSVSNQGGVDAKSLEMDEMHWLQSVRNKCDSPECLSKAYQERDAYLLNISRKAASPVAYEETKPYEATPEAIKAAQNQIGKPCDGAPSKSLEGFSKIRGFNTIITKDAYITGLDFKGDRFAFLLTMTNGDFQSCKVSDYAVLPKKDASESFLQCSMSDYDLVGLGIRSRGSKGSLFWSIDMGTKKLIRESLQVLGERSLICKQPETGE